MKNASAVLLRCVIGGFFIAAGIAKLGAPLGTLASVYAYDVGLPEVPAILVATALPWMEILLGLAVAGGVWMRVSLGWMAVMLSLFTLLTAQAWWRGLPIDCGCLDLGAIHPALRLLSSPGGASLRNLVLLGLIVALSRFAPESRANG